MWQLCWFVGQLSHLPCCECVKLVAVYNCCTLAKTFFLELLVDKQRDAMSPEEGVVCRFHLWHTHMLCCGYTRTKFMDHCSLFVCSVESYFCCCGFCTSSCTTKGHQGSVSSKQGLCIHVDCDKYHAMDTLMSLLWWFWKYHLVTHSILLNC